MREKISTVFFVLSIVIFIIAPIYQGIDANISNRSGDGVYSYGKDNIFTPLIGEEITYYYFVNGYGWEETGSEYIPPHWMVKTLNIKKEEKVKFSKGDNYEKIVPQWKWWVIFLTRNLIKLMIPGVFLILSGLISLSQWKEKKTSKAIR